MLDDYEKRLASEFEKYDNKRTLEIEAHEEAIKTKREKVRNLLAISRDEDHFELEEVVRNMNFKNMKECFCCTRFGFDNINFCEEVDEYLCEGCSMNPLVMRILKTE